MAEAVRPKQRNKRHKVKKRETFSPSKEQGELDGSSQSTSSSGESCRTRNSWEVTLTNVQEQEDPATLEVIAKELNPVATEDSKVVEAHAVTLPSENVEDSLNGGVIDTDKDELKEPTKVQEKDINIGESSVESLLNVVNKNLKPEIVTAVDDLNNSLSEAGILSADGTKPLSNRLTDYLNTEDIVCEDGKTHFTSNQSDEGITSDAADVTKALETGSLCKEPETEGVLSGSGAEAIETGDLKSKVEEKTVNETVGDHFNSQDELLNVSSQEAVVPGWLAMPDFQMTPVEADPFTMQARTRLDELAPSSVFAEMATNVVEAQRIATERNMKVGQKVHETMVVPAFAHISHTNDVLEASRNSIMMPFALEELERFYYNPELSQIENFVDQFIENAKKPIDEFRELLESYMKSRISAVALQAKIKELQETAKEKYGLTWSEKTLHFTAEGRCSDGNKVSHTFVSTVAVFNQEVIVELSNELKNVRSTLYEHYQLKAYDSQMARIRIESFLHEVFMSGESLKNVTSDWPISSRLPQDVIPGDIIGLINVQNCISSLFLFKRIGNLEPEFAKDVDEWLERMVATLQRAGALPDHFFILNHLVRCPPGSVAAVSHFLQFPSFLSPNHAVFDVWDNPLVHHFVIMLATLTLPIKQRKEFLIKFKENQGSQSIARGISWTLVDEEREEDENPQESWHLLGENDLAAIFEQFPFEDLLQYLLRTSKSDGKVLYDVTRSSSNDIMRLLAFSTCLANLLGEVFDIFNLLRYRQFLKRISRTIRLIVQVVSDHWCQYRNWRVVICGDSYQDIPNFLTISQQLSLSRLQLEFDNFFLRATKRILESQSFGVCQFLSCMPYDSISTHAATQVLAMLTSEERQGIRGSLTPARTQRALTAVPSPSEAIFLLTALSNLAVSRPAEDKGFIKSVVDYILEISFIDENTKGTCSKTGRDSLAAITESHPYIVSHLLSKMEQLFDNLEKEALAIFKALPVGIWSPLPSDLDVVRNWLLKCSLTSTQHQIARFILSSLNYGFITREGEKELFLDSGLHCAIAVMLVEVVGFCLPDSPGGIRDLQWQGSDIISQVSRIARSSYNRLMNASLQDSLVCWAFETGMLLKLHVNDIETALQGEERRNLLVSVEDSYHDVISSKSWFAAMAKAFSSHDPAVLDVTTSPELLNVNIAVESQGPIACFVTLCLTNEGHVPDLFMKRGLNNLLTIVSAGKIDPGLKVLTNVLPLFVDRPDILVADDRFLRSLDALVHIDANLAGYTEKLWQYHEPGVYSQKFAAVILASIAAEGKKSSDDALKAVNMWMRFLMSLQNWPKDCCVQVLLDTIVKAAFALEGGLEQVIDILQTEFTEILNGDFSKGFLSSVMSWISSTSASSPLSMSCHPEYNYYAYAVLSMETILEEKCGLWAELTAELLFDEKLPLEMAYKRALGRVKSPYLPLLGSLSIYRWAEQAMAASFDHPTLPIIWQQFFRLFLQKPSEESGLSGRHGIGYRFFRSFSYSSMAKRMKGLLLSAASYHQEKGRQVEESEAPSSPPGTSAKTHIHDHDFHVQLASLYQTLALWLDEPRLHDPSLLLAALPEVYRPDLLEQLYLGSKSPWLRYVNKKCIAAEVDALRSLWFAIIEPSSKYKRLPGREEGATQMGASQKIIKRLSFESNGKPAATLPPLAPPVPEITPQILLTRPCLVQGLSGELERVVQYSKRISSLLASHVGLDEEYAELSRDLYHNIETQKTQRVACIEKRKGCSGQATLRCQVRELVLNGQISSRLKVNREEWERLIENGLQPTPHNMCTGAVYVENIIAQLLKTLSYANPHQSTLLYDCGIRMFYLLAELIDNDIKRCNPAIQFFSSCVESLGKAFIAPNPNEQLRLIEAIMEKDAGVSFLAPHFSPNGDPGLFTTLYAALVRSITTENVTTVFVILSKFDVLQWLNSKPNYSDREATLRNAMCAVAAFGSKIPDGCSMVVDLLRGHICILLNHRFPELYFSTLQGLLHMSADNKISAVVWSDFILSIGGTVAGHRKPVPTPALQLPMAEAEETLERLKCFFLDAFASSDFSILQMYHTWSVYIPSLAQLYGHLLDKCLSLLSQNVNNVIDGQRALWLRSLDVYSVWILPNTQDDAWLQLHKQEVTVMIHSFTEFVCKACTILVNMGSKSLLNSVWQYYCQDIVTSLAAQEGALDLYHSLFLTIPWKDFCPTQQDLVLCLDMSSISPVPFRYVSKILFEINWTAVLASYSSQESNGPHNTLPAFFDSLLKIVLIMASDVVLMKSAKNRFIPLVKGIFSAPWYRLSRSQVEMTCKWYADICDSTEILDDASPLSTILYLLKPICGISLVSNDTNAFIGKRSTYVRTVVTILTRASTMSRSSPNRFRLALSRLLNDIESTVMADNVAMSHDLIDACISLLSLLNNFPAGVGLDAIRGAIYEYMPQTTRKEVILAFISASSRAIANLGHMSDLLECAIENIFSKLSDPELNTAWNSISERFSVPELDKEEFLKECLRKGNLLVLFVYTKVRREEQGLNPSTELNILIETVQWCSQVAPDNMSEYKMVLLIHQALQITESLVAKSSVEQQVLQLSKYLLFLSHTCNQLGEEKRYDGLLGMIGIGRRSSLSPSFRVYAKCIQTFILAQMPSSSVALRIREDSPGAIGVKGQPNSNSEADRGLLHLKNMSRTKLYGGLSEQIGWAVGFIMDPKNSMRDGANYSKNFMKELFYRYNAVMSVV